MTDAPSLPGGAPTPWAPVETLRVDHAEALRYLGHQGQVMDEMLSARITALEAELERAAAPRGVWMTCPLERPTERPGNTPAPVRLAGTAIELAGRDVRTRLAHARGCVVMACTLGMESERLLRRAGARSALDAAILDACASSLIEVAVDALEAQVAAALAHINLSCGTRFSPGYGDLPLSCQNTIVAALNATRLIGITLTPERLIVPTKSVTALMGIFERPPHEPAPDPCAGCRTRAGCAFRARGTRCMRARTPDADALS